MRAVARREGYVDSDLSTSGKFYLRRIVAPPSFTPNGGEAVYDIRQIRISFGSPTNQATDGACTGGLGGGGSALYVQTGYYGTGGEHSDGACQTLNPYLTSSQTRYTVNGADPTPSSGNLGNNYLISASSSEATYTIRAISYKNGWSDSDVSTSNVYTTRPIVATPTFTPDGATHTAGTRSITFTTATSTRGAEIRHTVQRYHGIQATVDTVFNNDTQYAAADFNADNYVEIALGNTTRIKVANDHSMCVAAVENAGVTNGYATANAAVQDGAEISVFNCDSASDNQKWLFDIDNDMIRYKSNSRFCLRKVGSGAANGDSIDLYTCAGCTSCGWLFDGTRISYKSSTSYCIQKSGSSLQLQSCGTDASMQWYTTNIVSTTKFSVGIWARIEADTADNGQLWGINRDDARLQLHSDMRLRTEATSGSSAHSTMSIQVRDGRWHHIAVTYGPNDCTIYVDGKPCKNIA